MRFGIGTEIGISRPSAPTSSWLHHSCSAFESPFAVSPDIILYVMIVTCRAMSNLLRSNIVIIQSHHGIKPWFSFNFFNFSFHFSKASYDEIISREFTPLPAISSSARNHRDQTSAYLMWKVHFCHLCHLSNYCTQLTCFTAQ